jgi:glycosyltransferase involved in cell wall biosynthesis
MIRASVILPAWSAAPSVKPAIRSALRQRVPRIAAIVIDAASAEATAEAASGGRARTRGWACCAAPATTGRAR